MSKMSNHFLSLQENGDVPYEPEDYYEFFYNKQRASAAKSINPAAATGRDEGGSELLDRRGPRRRKSGGQSPAPAGVQIPEQEQTKKV